MTNDILLGAMVSVSLHVALLFGGGQSPARKIAKAILLPDKIIEVTPMPPSDEEPEVVEAAEGETPPPDLAPPTQPDTLQPIQPDSFVQKVQPPPPEGLDLSKSMNVVPNVRSSGVLRSIQVFVPGMLDQTPVPKFQRRPQYPFEMRRQGIAGEVVVDFIVDANGDVQNAWALRSSQREFEAAAVAAVAQWRFRPGRKGGRAVATHLQVPILFTLNEE